METLNFNLWNKYGTTTCQDSVGIFKGLGQYTDKNEMVETDIIKRLISKLQNQFSRQFHET